MSRNIPNQSLTTSITEHRYSLNDAANRYRPECNKFNVYYREPSKLNRADLMNQYFQNQKSILQQEQACPWITDKLSVSDINGAQSDAYGLLRFIRGADGNLKTDDIIGTGARSRNTGVRPSYSLETRDLNSNRKQFFSKRNCNPLEPVYKIVRFGGPPIEVGPIEGNQPRPLQPKLSIQSKGTLTADIHGAQPRKLGAVTETMADDLRKVGAFSYINENLIGNGDIIAQRDGAPLQRNVSQRRFIVPHHGSETKLPATRLGQQKREFEAKYGTLGFAGRPEQAFQSDENQSQAAGAWVRIERGKGIGVCRPQDQLNQMIEKRGGKARVINIQHSHQQSHELLRKSQNKMMSENGTQSFADRVLQRVETMTPVLYKARSELLLKKRSETSTGGQNRSALQQKII